MATTKSNQVVLGEYGRYSGAGPVETVRLVPGHVREIQRLWRELDDCDAIREDEIFRRLAELGATR